MPSMPSTPSEAPGTLVLVRLLAVADANPVAGREVVAALVSEGERAVGPVAGLLADARRPAVVRAAAAVILRRIGGPRAATALAGATHDAEPLVAAVASAACPAA